MCISPPHPPLRGPFSPAHAGEKGIRRERAREPLAPRKRGEGGRRPGEGFAFSDRMRSRRSFAALRMTGAISVGRVENPSHIRNILRFMKKLAVILAAFTTFAAYA